MKKNYIYLILLFLFSCIVFFVNYQINNFRFNNFDFGKFDLGNMAQMLWNTQHGRFMYLTDYFGTNLPRWAMSHVDPILLLTLPFFVVFPHSMTLVYFQVFIVIFASFIVYKIADQELNSKTSAFFISIAYLFYPAIGFLTAWTGYHGVTVAIPFFFGAFYVYEYMYKNKKFTKRNIFLFCLLIFITLMGKEQISLYILLYGFFIWVYRGDRKIGLSLITTGAVWFILCFFVIIPHYSKYRAEGFALFAKSIEIDTTSARDVSDDNYFISRYSAFGDSYQSIVLNMILNPSQVVSVFFGGDKMTNIRMTLEPVGYLPLLFPLFFVIAIPDLLINYMTTAGGIGTAEIYNHRISMIIPVLFISSIFAIGFLSNLSRLSFLKKFKIKNYYLTILISLLFCLLNVYTSFAYQNPVYLWLSQAIAKKISGSISFAKTNLSVGTNENLKVGDVLRLSKLENKDRECAQKVISLIPDDATVSGPDYLGAHLGLRETYAIFPALYNSADYVIVDVFSKKILNILDVDLNINRDVVGKLIKDPNYDMEVGCGNLFVFKKLGPHNKSSLLPMQERFSYDEKVNLDLFQTIAVVDYTLPTSVERGVLNKGKFTYVKRESTSLDDYVMFMVFINTSTGLMHQSVNIPSFGLIQLRDWVSDRYYIEEVPITLPKYLEAGTYKVFIGISNNIRTRSLYIGNMEVL